MCTKVLELTALLNLATNAPMVMYTYPATAGQDLAAVQNFANIWFVIDAFSINRGSSLSTLDSTPLNTFAALGVLTRNEFEPEATLTAVMVVGVEVGVETAVRVETVVGVETVVEIVVGVETVVEMVAGVVVGMVVGVETGMVMGVLVVRVSMRVVCTPTVVSLLASSSLTSDALFPA